MFLWKSLKEEVCHTVSIIFTDSLAWWGLRPFYTPEEHIMYLPVVSWFLISFVMGGNGPSRANKFLYGPAPPPPSAWTLKPPSWTFVHKTTNTPMIYTALCIMFWMHAYPLWGQVGGGWALEFESFLGLVKWHWANRWVPHLGPKKNYARGCINHRCINS